MPKGRLSERAMTTLATRPSEGESIQEYHLNTLYSDNVERVFGFLIGHQNEMEYGSRIYPEL
jgi:hypothetical protein